ncbi:hypothetical protein ILYODFUR_026025 [Ilyodon furcidens]|uniref:Uncharacterized protein n=1 Tax=Ilyodon furcidens TaxID=33524 RepID=A0ABV0VI66_9TELE
MILRVAHKMKGKKEGRLVSHSRNMCCEDLKNIIKAEAESIHQVIRKDISTLQDEAKADIKTLQNELSLKIETLHRIHTEARGTQKEMENVYMMYQTKYLPQKRHMIPYRNTLISYRENIWTWKTEAKGKIYM